MQKFAVRTAVGLQERRYWNSQWIHNIKPRIRRIRDGIASEFATEFTADSRRIRDGFARRQEFATNSRNRKFATGFRWQKFATDSREFTHESSRRIREPIEFASKDSWSHSPASIHHLGPRFLPTCALHPIPKSLPEAEEKPSSTPRTKVRSKACSLRLL